MIADFAEAYHSVHKDPGKYGSYEQHPLYTKLQEIHARNLTLVQSTGRLSVEHVTRTLPVQRGVAPIGTNDELRRGEASGEESSKEATTARAEDEVVEKRHRTCDYVFAEYLNVVAQRVRPECYAQVLAMVLSYRDYANKCAGQEGPKAATQTPAQTQTSSQTSVAEPLATTQDDYCSTHNAEDLPDLCNRFISKHLELHTTRLNKNEAIAWVLNMCHWIYMNGYSCSKLLLLNDSLIAELQD